MSFPVMDQETEHSFSCGFSDKVLPRFDGHSDYASYREDITLWTNLTTLPANKHVLAIIGRIQGEAKTAAKTIGTDPLCVAGGVELTLARSDKEYAIDKTNKLDADPANFFDYTWGKKLSVEHFISGFHTRVDKISELNLNEKLKGHLLLRQAELTYHERHVVIGAASGSYDVHHVSAAVRNIYRNASSAGSSHHGSIPTQYGRNENNNTRAPNHSNNHGRRRGGRGRAHGSRIHEDRASIEPRPTFYSYKNSVASDMPHVIIDIGAFSSVVGKDTLDEAMRQLHLDKV